MCGPAGGSGPECGLLGTWSGATLSSKPELDAALPRSHRLAAVRAALLADLGQAHAAREAYEHAVELCGNDLEAEHRRGRLAAFPG